VLEGGLDLLLELRLAQDRLFVRLRGALEEGAFLGGHLPDGLQLVEPEEPRQAKGIARIFFIVVRADEFVVARVAHHQLRDVRAQQLPEPARQVGFFQRQALVRRGDGLDLGDEPIELRGDAPELALGAVIVELGQHAGLSVRIQPPPCYRSRVWNEVSG
jgi:hypothetical protein